MIRFRIKEMISPSGGLRYQAQRRRFLVFWETVGETNTLPEAAGAIRQWQLATPARQRETLFRVVR